MAATAVQLMPRSVNGCCAIWLATSRWTSAFCATTTTLSARQCSSLSGRHARTSPILDPIGVVYFADADSVFAGLKTSRSPTFCGPSPRTPTTSGASRRARPPDCRHGVRSPAFRRPHHRHPGFVKFGDREWLPDELNALQAIATLFAQLQARIVAEEQVPLPRRTR